MIRTLWNRVRPLPLWARRASDPLLAPYVVLQAAPLVSVVMTAYNAAEWIEAAIDSILVQSWQNLEVIVVDDASTDETAKIICSVVRRDSRVQLLGLKSNSGTYVAKNQGISKARGEVLTFMDSDDISEPQRLARQLELLRTPGLVATTCDYVRVDSLGHVVLNRGMEQRQALISLMIKRAVIDDIGWFDSVRWAADDEFFERLRHVYGRSAHANVPERLYRALVRTDSLSAEPGNAVKLTGDDNASLSLQRRCYRAAYGEWHDQLSSRQLRPWIPKGTSSVRAFHPQPSSGRPQSDTPGVEYGP